MLTHVLIRGLVTALAIVVLALAAGCLTEAGVEEEIDEANYCETASECVVIYPGCPLGCWAVVNEAEEGRIQDLVDDYHSQQTGSECMYDCPAHTEPACEGGRCVVEAAE